jgi:hypothetical protein
VPEGASAPDTYAYDRRVMDNSKVLMMLAPRLARNLAASCAGPRSCRW